MTDGGKRFTRRKTFDGPELVGARWWSESLKLSAPAPERTRTLTQVAVAAGVVGAIGLFVAVAAVSTGTRFDESTITRKALDAQKADGWDVASDGAKLAYPDARDVDATGESVAAADERTLAKDLAPSRSDLAPWYVSTLFQSIELPSNEDLRAGLRAVDSPSMDAAYARGESVSSLFESAADAGDVALIVDLPGPESVAFAAGLAPRFDPVFAFDNWPHPRGVVPSHLALGAAAYYRRWFMAHRAAAGAPPAFVLDRSRLAPYVDDAGRFDNRYVARIPSAAQFALLGVKHVLYVAPAGDDVRELDDLNADFVALKAAGIDVKTLCVSDLRESTVEAAATPTRRHAYWYGGSPYTHWWFWRSYGWHAPPPGVRIDEPSGISRGFGYVPTARPTIFSYGTSAEFHGPPRGFGNVTYHEASPGATSGRSGSFGRSSFSSGG